MTQTISAPSPTGSRAVPYRDALRFGAICGVIVVVLTFFMTKPLGAEDGWPLFRVVLYGIVCFTVVSAVASLLNWVVSKKTYSTEEISAPVLD